MLCWNYLLQDFIALGRQYVVIPSPIVYQVCSIAWQRPRSLPRLKPFFFSSCLVKGLTLWTFLCLPFFQVLSAFTVRDRLSLVFGEVFIAWTEKSREGSPQLPEGVLGRVPGNGDCLQVSFLFTVRLRAQTHIPIVSIRALKGSEKASIVRKIVSRKLPIFFW